MRIALPFGSVCDCVCAHTGSCVAMLQGVSCVNGSVYYTLCSTRGVIINISVLLLVYGKLPVAKHCSLTQDLLGKLPVPKH